MSPDPDRPGHFVYAYPRPALTVDVAVLGVREGALCVLLVRRGGEPFRGYWALPGGFVHVDEGLEWAARRELLEEASVEPAWIEQIGAFGDPGRDPRERVVSVAYWALVRPESHAPVAASDAEAVAWCPVAALPPLAFDHAAILDAGVARMRRRTWDQRLGADIIDTPFTLAELQAAEESLLGRPLDKRNFRRRVTDDALLVDTGQSRQDAAHRPARLYRLQRDLSKLGDQP